MIHELEQRIKQLEAKLGDAQYDVRKNVQSEFHQRFRMDMQTSFSPQLRSALCVSTLDPLGEGYVRFYTPAVSAPGTPVSGLPWAAPISPFGGFDDCGVTWVPPAGSKLALLCENGDKNQFYYIGTFYTRTRGKSTQAAPDDTETQDSGAEDVTNNRNDIWGYNIPEYDCVWEGNRNGYNFGENDGSEVKMAWNTESYNIKDWDSTKVFTDGTINEMMTYPYVYGAKTPGKHYWKFVDGDQKCNQRWRRLEIATGRCNILMMKDDHLHPAGQWAFNGKDEDEQENEEDTGEEGDDTEDTGEEENADQFVSMDDLSECHTPNEDEESCTEALEDTDCKKEDEENQHGENEDENPDNEDPDTQSADQDTEKGELTDEEEEDQDEDQGNDEMDHAKEDKKEFDKRKNRKLIFANPFYKREEEMRFYKPPQSLAQYQNPRCELDQSGIQLQSIAGGTLVIDDSVDQPSGKPDWSEDWTWGCNDISKCKIFIRSVTGHMIELNDEEDQTHIRNKHNGIKIVTAAGNRIELLDHTEGDPDEEEEEDQNDEDQEDQEEDEENEDPDTQSADQDTDTDEETEARNNKKEKKAGKLAGIFLQSTANHVLDMRDEGNRRNLEPRQQGGMPEALADKAYVLLRSGYGIQLRMDDSTSQEKTDAQYLQLLSPQKDNTKRGPHQMVFQEQKEGPGLVMLRAGGVYYRSSYDSAIEVVGEERDGEDQEGSEEQIEEDQKEKIIKYVQVMGDYIVDSEGYYFNHNDLTIFQSEKYIILFAGRDCPMENPEEQAQSASESASGNAQTAKDSQAQGTPNDLPLDKGPCLFPVVVGKDPWVCPMYGFVHYGVMSDPADPTHTKLLHNSLSDRVFASASQDQASKDAAEEEEEDDTEDTEDEGDEN